MKQCNTKGCGSFQVNIERNVPRDICLCDVCHWKKQYMDTHQYLSNLLAIIHRDGGHYMNKHGIDKTVKDAHKILVGLMSLENDRK
jgi:hypothetical protein